MPQFGCIRYSFPPNNATTRIYGAIAKELYTDFGVRRYGFHGTSHYFVSREAAKMLNKPVEDTASSLGCLGVTAHQYVLSKTVTVLVHQWGSHTFWPYVQVRCGDLDQASLDLLKKGWSQGSL
ncbi:hypothetical protein OH492_10270 [Vibrio chagasii]|nr:hypothetical protein [Vibrio chagasii]